MQKRVASERAEGASPARRSKLPWIVAAAAILVAAVSVGLLLSLFIPPPKLVAWFPLKLTFVSVGLLW